MVKKKKNRGKLEVEANGFGASQTPQLHNNHHKQPKSVASLQSRIRKKPIPWGLVHIDL
jgi:hypothetical protein